MRSGCPNSQGGAYSAFQRRTNFGALPSPQDISVTPVPVVHPENGIKNMLATQYPGELRVASLPAQQESQPSTVSTGFQHPIPRDSACTSRNSWHQINRELNADLYSSAHVSPQYSSYFEASADERSVRHPDSGQQRECSKQRFSRHFLKGSNLNIDTGLQRRQLLNSAASPGTNSAALQGDNPVVGSQACSLQDQCFSATECKLQRSYPLLMTLLTTPSSSSEETANIELNTITHFSDERLYTGLQVKSPLAALNCGQTRKQNLDHSGGTIFIPHRQVSSRSLSSQLSTDRVLPVGEMAGLTDGQILDIIEKKLAYFRTVLKSRDYGHFSNQWDRDSTLQPDSIMPNVNSVAHLPTTSDKEYAERQGLNCTVTEQCTAAVGQAREEESSKGSKANAELTPKSKEMDDCATSASERRSTGKLISAVNKNLEDIDHAPGDSLALKHITEREKGGISPKPVEAVGFDSVQGMTDVSEDLQTKSSSVVSENKTFEHASLIENQDANPKKQKNIDDQQHCDVAYKEVIVHSKQQNQIHNIVSIPTNKSEWLSNPTSREGAREDACSVRSQTNLSTAFSEKVKKLSPLSGGDDEEAPPVKNVIHSQYEDISGDESQLATNLPNTEHEELSFSACFENPEYEDISEDESPQIEYTAVETSSEVPEPNNEQSPFENEGYGHVQGQAQTNTEIIPDEELIPKEVSPVTETLDVARFVPCVVETDNDFEGLLSSKCDSERHTNHSVSCSPSSVLKDEDETDDQIDDDFLVIPIIVSDLKFEPLDEDQDSLEKNVLDVGETGDKDRQRDTSPTQWPDPKPVPVTAFSPMEAFDTVTIFLKNYTNTLEVASRSSTPEHEMDSESEVHTTPNRRESLDSCETEDSCDYSPASAHTNNCLTVSRKMLKKTTEPLPSETEDSESEKESEDNEETNMQKGQTLQKLGMLIKSKAVSKCVQPKIDGQTMSKMDDIIIIDLEEDSGSEDSGDAPCSQQNRHSPETVDSRSGTVKEKFEKKDMDIIIVSDSEDDNDQNYKKPKRKISFSSGSDSDDAPCVEQKRQSPETVDSEYRTAKEKPQETSLSSADSSQPQHQSKCHDRHYKEVMRDACPDLSDSMKKNRQLIEAKGGSDHVPDKANRKTSSKRRVSFHDDKVVKKSHFSKKKARIKILPSSESEDSGDDSFDTKNRPSTETVDRLCGTSNERPQKNRLSSEDSPEKQPYSVDNGADSTFGPVPVIPRLVVVKPSQPNQNLKLLKEPRVHRQGKDVSQTLKTSVASSKKKDSCEKNTLHLNKNDQGQFVPKPKPANDRQYATKNNIQANVPKPRMVSRQLSSPRQEGPDTFFSTLSSTNGQLSEARQSSASSRDLSQSGETSASCSLPTSKQSTSVPRQQMSSSKLVRSHSYSNPSTLNHPPTKGPSATQSSAREPKSKVYQDWANSYVPTRRDRKTSLDDLSTKNDSRKEARPGPSHQDKAPRLMRNFHESATPLMKKAKMFAIQRTKDINRDAQREQSVFF